MAGKIMITNANGKTVTLQNPDTNNNDNIVVDISNILSKEDGNIILTNTNGKKVTLQNPDTNNNDIIVDMSNMLSKEDGISKTELTEILEEYSITDGLGGGAIMGKPVIVSPVNDAVNFVGAITSTYVTTNNYKGLQDWVLWECSTNDTFTNIIDSYEGNSNLTSWVPSIGLANT